MGYWIERARNDFHGHVLTADRDDDAPAPGSVLRIKVMTDEGRVYELEYEPDRAILKSINGRLMDAATTTAPSDPGR